MSTQYHSKFWATLLTLKGSAGSLASLSRSIGNARVDLNPHQVDAAIFALRSPFSKGAILADEVGLGKTIEAGIVLAQKWAERKRRILLVVPATLRKQWYQELLDKFYLPSSVLETRSFNQLKKSGQNNPFEQSQIVICSYNFIAARMDDVRRVPWDIAVIDEAHRLRNVYKKDNKIARKIADALGGVTKILLSATPLQNNLMELYGLVSLIDEHVFGDEASFRQQFGRIESDATNYGFLRERISSICTRTLRKQVREYVSFTARLSITQDFTPSSQEQELYDKVSAYLQRETLAALPSGQRKLMTLVLRKLLASSTYAISGTLQRLVTRLQELKAVTPDVADDFESLEELEEEWDGEGDPATPPSPADALRGELQELEAYARMAQAIVGNAKGDALLVALPKALKLAEERGAREKAVIFTESRRTQEFLFNLLNEHGYAGKVVMLNGSNTDPLSKTIYGQWIERHKGKSVVSGSKVVDIKAAIVEEFRERATILVATEAAAEGVNLQFCSLVVNYDLPWNPQRIEQRIGRCHRYGQESDVVVVNFINRANEADQRVYDLLSQKFKLFDGVFGASDEVLGAIESGVDLEKRIAEVYQTCRSNDDIKQAFDLLQSELDEQIQSRMAQTRQTILDNFDQEVHDRLKLQKQEAEAQLSEREKWLLSLARQEFGPDAKFDKELPRFEYKGADGAKGFYHLQWKYAELQGDEFFRTDHPLADRMIQKALSRTLTVAQLNFDYKSHGTRQTALEPFIGKSGWLEFSKLSVDSVSSEEFPVFAAFTDDGELLDEELCRKLLRLSAKVTPLEAGKYDDSWAGFVKMTRESEVKLRLISVESRNAVLFDEEEAKLDRWAEDMKISLEREIKSLDEEIKEARRESKAAAALADKIVAQKRLKSLELTRKEKRQRQYLAQDEVDTQREGLIEKLEAQLKQQSKVQPLFTARWSLA